MEEWRIEGKNEGLVHAALLQAEDSFHVRPSAALPQQGSAQLSLGASNQVSSLGGRFANIYSNHYNLCYGRPHTQGNWASCPKCSYGS